MHIVRKPEHGSEEWLRLRWRDSSGRCVFGASEAASLMGQSPYVSRGDLFASKRSEPMISEQTEAFRRGHVLEPALLAEAGRILGAEVSTPGVMYRDGRWIATLDGIVGSPEKPEVIVEAKTTTRYSIRDAEDLPAEWLWQTWVQGSLLGAEVFIMALDRDQRLSLTKVPSNPQAWEALLTEAERLGSSVDEGHPLAPDEFNYEQITDLWRATPRVAELPNEAAQWLHVLVDARDLKAQAETQEKQAKDALARMLLDAEVGVLNGQQVITWKEQAGRASLDESRLRQDHPDLCSAYEKPGRPYRVMRVSSGKPTRSRKKEQS
ncbi:MAG: hypothetical protein EBZ87_00115 [Microbacteriaceae bacterium]|nr:hypothetical protein [Microbacteriaceae bacterium]